MGEQRMSSEDTDDFRRNLGNRLRDFILEHPQMVKTVPGFLEDLDGKRQYELPYPAVNWDSLLLQGHKGLYFRKLTRGNNWRSILEFRETQEGQVRFSEYRRYKCMLLADSDDVPPDTREYFEVQQSLPTVPLGVVLIDTQRADLRISGEIRRYSGTAHIAMYGPAGEQGLKLAYDTAQEMAAILEANQDRRKYYGIRSIEISGEEQHAFPRLSESSIDFRYDIDLNMQEDHYWQTIY